MVGILVMLVVNGGADTGHDDDDAAIDRDTGDDNEEEDCARGYIHDDATASAIITNLDDCDCSVC